MSAVAPVRSTRAGSGFILLPVVLALSLIASIAFLANRDSGANVAMVASGSDSDQARYAAEAGLEHANFVVQQKSCGGPYPQSTTPVVNDVFAGASYTAYADRASGNSVQITSTGSYNGASVTLRRPNVIVYQSTLQTFTVQPDTVDGKDTYLSSSSPSTNYGGDTVLRLQQGSYQALIQFDTSVLPAGSRPLAWYDSTKASLMPGAKLSLYQTQNVNGATVASAYLVTTGWTEGKGPTGGSGGATWNASDGSAAWPGQSYHPLPVASAPTSDPAGWKEWDVTDVTAAWLFGEVPNNGLWLIATGAKKDAQYVSSEEAVDLTLRPKVSLTYLLPCGSKAPQQTELAPTRDTEIDNSNPDTPKGTAVLMSVSPSRGRQVLLAFDSNAIPSGSTVASARLRLYLDTGIPVKTSAALNLVMNAVVTQSWAENATWNDPATPIGFLNSILWQLLGSIYRLTPTGTATLAQGVKDGRWVEFDARALVQEWVDGVTVNQGVVVRSTTSASDELKFSSREALDPTRRPRLVVTYR